MNSFDNKCVLCLLHNNNIKDILTKDEDNIIIEDKLKYVFLDDIIISYYNKIVNLEPYLNKYICTECLIDLNNVYKFKQKCSKNLKSLCDLIEETKHKNTQQTFKIKTEAPSEEQIGNVIIKMEPEEVQDILEEPTNNLEERASNLEEVVVKSELEEFNYETDIKNDPLLTDETEEKSKSPASNLGKVPPCALGITNTNCDKIEEDNNENVPEDIIKEANDISFNLLPEKSKGRYMNEFEKFREWMLATDEESVTEEVILEYFNGLIDKYAPPSLWSTYSMLRATLLVFQKVDISKFKTLFTILKNKSKGYQPKKAKTFDLEDVEKFVNEAPDDVFLLMKVVVVLGIIGACRCDDLVNLKTTDIEDNGSTLVVKILKTKSYKPRSFVVTSSPGIGFNGIEIYRKYAALRPAAIGEGRFFLCYRAGKCSLQPVGINSLSKIPRLVASYLKLKDSHLYTGHCFRQSSATFLEHASAAIMTHKRYGGSLSVTDKKIKDKIIMNTEDSTSTGNRNQVEVTTRATESQQFSDNTDNNKPQEGILIKEVLDANEIKYEIVDEIVKEEPEDNYDMIDIKAELQNDAFLYETDNNEDSTSKIDPKPFATEFNLKVHEQSIDKDRPFKCSVCNKMFTQKSVLTKHMLIHTGEKPFKCDVCGKVFNQSSVLMLHKRCHTGEKPYKCDACDKSFKQKGHLELHKRSHIAEKPYKCDICDKAFNQKSHLVYHTRCHTGEKPYKCDVCDKTFSQRCHLVSHKRCNTGEEPYKCYICDKLFNLKCHLQNHITLSHR